MERATLGNRPTTQAPMSRIEDFVVDGTHVRVSLKLKPGPSDDIHIIDAQAFEVDANGINIPAPDGRPSRTGSTGHTVQASSLGDTHTLKPGWVRIVGDYDASTFEPTAARAMGKPVAGVEPDWESNPTGQHFDTETGIGYRWDEGENLRVARGKVQELLALLRNSAPIAGIDF